LVGGGHLVFTAFLARPGCTPDEAARELDLDGKLCGTAPYRFDKRDNSLE